MAERAGETVRSSRRGGNRGPAAAAKPTRPPTAPSRAALILRATRPQYIPTSLVPALAGACAAIGVPGAQWELLPVALMALLCVHAGTDVINDVEDAARGVDSAEKIDNSRVFNTGLMSIVEARGLPSPSSRVPWSSASSWSRSRVRRCW